MQASPLPARLPEAKTAAYRAPTMYYEVCMYTTSSITAALHGGTNQFPITELDGRFGWREGTRAPAPAPAHPGIAHEMCSPVAKLAGRQRRKASPTGTSIRSMHTNKGICAAPITRP